MERITIVGIGPIGASIGLALKRADLGDVEVVATSGDRDTLSEAVKMGAVDQAVGNLRSALDGARMVVLDTSITETREVMEAIGPILDDGSVVTDTGTAKTRVIKWADEYLPKGVGFVGGHPLMKTQPFTMEEADSSLFRGINYCIIPADSADQRSVKAVVDLVEALGAQPLFLDEHEHDSYAAAMTHLPIVLSAAFVTATAGSGGWREMHRLAASEFGDFSRLASEDPEDNEAACLANPDALVRWLDQIITELYAYRNQIKDTSDTLLDTFISAWEARARWEAGAVVQDDRLDYPSAGASMASALLGSGIVDRYRRVKDGSRKKRESWRYPDKK